MPKTFLVVVLLFVTWAALMALVVVSPGTVNTLYFITSYISSWVFMFAVAIVGALLIGMFISHRLISHGEFTPFEEEMMRMRKEVQTQLTHTEKMREEVSLLRLEVARLKRPGHAEDPPESAGGTPASRRTSQAALSVGPVGAGDEGPQDVDEFGR